MTVKLCNAHARAHCPECPQRGTSRTARGYGWDYQKARRPVLAGARSCWLCGEPERPDDPFETDHVVPTSLGGRTAGNLRAAHRSCNRRRGSGANGINPIEAPDDGGPEVVIL